MVEREVRAILARSTAAGQTGPSTPEQIAADRSEDRSTMIGTTGRTGQLAAVFQPAMPYLHADSAWVREACIEYLPQNWAVVESGQDGWTLIGPPPALLKLILSGHVESDGNRWLHGSVSGVDRVPTWDEMVNVKELFCGTDSLALMLIPPRKEWVNIHPFCLHFWINVDKRPTPDFTSGRGSV